MYKNQSLRDQKGFTLVEIAIVLVIIGLLIGGVLKGQSMIYNAKIKRLVNDIEGMRTAVITYQDRYGQLPGDENDTNTPTGDSNNGNNNGQIAETVGWAIEDLRLAGLISGTGTALPANAFNGTINVQWSTIVTGGTASNFILSTQIPAEVCQEIDSKYDDGVQTTGAIRGSAAYTAGTIVPTFGWAL
jgi:prepilin-type N-terminal cleavage/methylation domain-containing protein